MVGPPAPGIRCSSAYPTAATSNPDKDYLPVTRWWRSMTACHFRLLPDRALSGLSSLGKADTKLKPRVAPSVRPS